MTSPEGAIEGLQLDRSLLTTPPVPPEAFELTTVLTPSSGCRDRGRWQRDALRGGRRVGSPDWGNRLTTIGDDQAGHHLAASPERR